LSLGYLANIIFQEEELTQGPESPFPQETSSDLQKAAFRFRVLMGTQMNTASRRGETYEKL
jgi:hypothetical protein